MKTCFHSHFYTNFHASANFAIFVQIIMKFSPKCRTKKLGIIYTILGSFCSFFNCKGADIRPQIRPRKISARKCVIYFHISVAVIDL